MKLIQLSYQIGSARLIIEVQSPFDVKSAFYIKEQPWEVFHPAKMAADVFNVAAIKFADKAAT